MFVRTLISLAFLALHQSFTLAAPHITGALEARADAYCNSGIYGELLPFISPYAIAQAWCTNNWPVPCTAAHKRKRAVTSSTTTTPAKTTTAANNQLSAWSKALQQAQNTVKSMCYCMETTKACPTTTTSTIARTSSTTSRSTTTKTSTTSSSRSTTTKASPTTSSSTTTKTSPTTSSSSTTTKTSSISSSSSTTTTASPTTTTTSPTLMTTTTTSSTATTTSSTTSSTVSSTTTTSSSSASTTSSTTTESTTSSSSTTSSTTTETTSSSSTTSTTTTTESTTTMSSSTTTISSAAPTCTSGTVAAQDGVFYSVDCSTSYTGTPFATYSNVENLARCINLCEDYPYGHGPAKSCYAVNYLSQEGNCYLLSDTNAGSTADDTTDAATRYNYGCPNAPVTGRGIGIAGGQYIVYGSQFYYNYNPSDILIGTNTGISSIQDCFNLCDVTPNCGFLNYAPDSKYCQLLQRKNGAYCQTPLSSYNAAVKIN